LKNKIFAKDKERFLKSQSIEMNLLVKERKTSNKKSYQTTNETNIAKVYWQECLQIIKDNVDSQAYKTWFKPITALSYIDNKLLVQLPSEWFREWLDTNFYDLINKTIKRVAGEEAELIYDVVIVESNGKPHITVLYPPKPSLENDELLEKI